jgi:hypothetical protein
LRGAHRPLIANRNRDRPTEADYEELSSLRRSVPIGTSPFAYVAASSRRIGVDEDARGHSVRAGQCESAWRGPVRKETFPVTRQDWIDEQQDLIRKPLFEQHRCQRRTAPEDQAWPVHRLDSANALNDVRSKTLERTPFKTVRPVGLYIFRGRIQAVRERTARGLRPKARSDIVVDEPATGIHRFSLEQRFRNKRACKLYF